LIVWVELESMEAAGRLTIVVDDERFEFE